MKLRRKSIIKRNVETPELTKRGRPLERAGPFFFGFPVSFPLSSWLRLSSYAFGRCTSGFRVAQVVMTLRLQAVVQLVDEGNSRRDVQLDDRRFRDPVQILDERTQAVAVSGNDDPLAGLNRRGDRVVPVRKEASDRVLQRFSQRQIAGADVGVPRIARRMTRIVQS